MPVHPRLRIRLLSIAVSLLIVAGCSERRLGPEGRVDSPSSDRSGGAPEFVLDQIVVEVAPGWTLDQIHSIWGTSTIAEISGSSFALLQIPPIHTVETLTAELLLAGACTTCDPNYYLASPEAQEGSIAFYEGNLTSGDLSDQNAMVRIQAHEARKRLKGKGITVAILDTGIDASHPAFGPHVRTDGWDFVAMDSDPHDEADGLDQDLDGLVDEGAGHGTHVAGIVHFIAPRAPLLPVRVLDSEGNGTIFAVAQGVDFATTAGAHVINLSLALNGYSTVADWTIENAHAAGVLVVSSAGNDGVESDTHFPASLPDVMGVAAVDAADLKASFSNYGSIVAISAPGVGIVSTYRFQGYAVWSGTSMAASFVSGAAALATQSVSGGTPDDVRTKIENAAAPMNHAGQPYEGKMGAGRLDVLGAILAEIFF